MANNPAQQERLNALRASLSPEDVAELSQITSQQAFNAWRSRHPQARVSWQETQLLQSSQPQEAPVQEDAAPTHQQNAPHLPTSPAQKNEAGASEKTYAKSLEEEKAYQNIVKSHVDEWKQQNPRTRTPVKTFIKDENGNRIINPNLLERIKSVDPTFDLHGAARQTYATAFGADRLEHYDSDASKRASIQRDYQQLQEAIRTNPAQSDHYYRSFFQSHPDIASELRTDDRLLHKAQRSYQREQRQGERERLQEARTQARSEEKIRRTIFRDEQGTPTLERDPAYNAMQQRVAERTKAEIDRQTAEIRRVAPHATDEMLSAKINPSSVREQIHKEELQSLIRESDPTKIARYARHNPELRTTFRELQQAQRETLRNEQKANRELGKLPRQEQLRRAFAEVDAHIKQQTQAELDRQLQEYRNRLLHPTQQDFLNRPQFDSASIRQQIQTELTQQEYERIAREHPEIANEYAKTNPQMQQAVNAVNEAQNKAKRRGLRYKLQQRLKKSRVGKYLSEKRRQITKSRLADTARLINKHARDNVFTRVQTRFRNGTVKVLKGTWNGISRSVRFVGGNIKAGSIKIANAFYNSRPVQFLLAPFRFLGRQWRRLSDRLDRLNNNRIAAQINFSKRFKEWFKNTRIGGRLNGLSERFKAFKKKLANNRFVRGLRSAADLITDPAAFARQQLKNLAKNIAKRIGKRLASAGLKLAARGLSALASGGVSALASLGGAALSGLMSGVGALGGAIAAGASALVAVAAPLLPWILGIGGGIVLFLLLWCALFGSCAFFGGNQNGAGAVGVAINKTGPDHVTNGANITYNINVSYTSTASEVTVKDQLDPNVEFVQANGPGNPTYDKATHTVTWTIVGSGGSSSPGNGTPAPPGVNVLPNQETCDGVYTLTGNERNGKNFGDPTCDLARTPLVPYSFKGHSWQVRKGLLDLLQQLDPSNVGYWLGIAECESGIDPNDVTPAVNGVAYGLFQMGARIVNGSESPYGEGIGLNGKYDRGDVNWRNQVSNAVNYNKEINGSWKYWACARDVWGLWN